MVVYVFPGQGSQQKGMGEGLFREYRTLTDTADEILGYSIEELCMKDPENTLGNTQYTQPALYVVNALLYTKKIEETGQEPDFVAGHSLGEYSALFASGAIDFETGLHLVKKRGELMAQAKDGGMSAVIGLNEEQIRETLEHNGLHTIDIANLNSPSQIVISGPKEDIVKAQPVFESAGCKLYIPLKVSGAFHSRLMEDASREFAEHLSQFRFSDIRIPVISNVLARPYPQASIEQLLADQMIKPVKWTESVRYLMGKGGQKFLEIGPGNVLTRLILKIQREADPLVIEEKGEVESSRFSTTQPERAPGVQEKGRLSERTGKQGEAGNPSIIATREAGDKPSQNLVFMYSGQGSQYYHMGKELYQRNDLFRKSMEQCSAMLEQELPRPLIEVIYDDSKKFEDFDDILYTHPAVLCVQYSLTQVLHGRGVSPNSVVGYSLGEYVAAVIAGVLSLEQALRLVVQQAKLLRKSCQEGGMLVVLDRVETFQENPRLFQGCTLAGINYENCFVVSGQRGRLREIQSQLKDRSVVSQCLPVLYGFHSAYIDPIKSEFEKFIEGTAFQFPQLPLYSSAKRGRVAKPEKGYWWEVVRGEVHFKELIALMYEQERCVFVDVSPTGTLANFIKHGFKGAIPSYFAMNPFGQNLKTLDKLVSDLHSLPVSMQESLAN